jgi:ABC-2 type transport system permease protein
MNKVMLWLVGLANPLWKSFGADPRALGLILSAKLKMDDRGGYVMGQQQKPKSGMEYLVFFFMTLFGAFTIFFFVTLEHHATAVGLLFSFWIIYIGLLLITELSETLFDARDLYVLLSRPITDVTLSLSRILHIGVFTTKFALCFGVPVSIYLIFWQGIWPFLVFFLLAIITVILTMTGTLVFYLILLRKVPAHKLKKIIGYFQMVATGFFFILYQLPQFLDSMDGIASTTLSGEWTGFLFPGLWMGGWWSVLVEGGATNLSWVQGLLALLAASAGAMFYVSQSANYGERLLELRMAGSGAEEAVKGKVMEEGAARSPWYRDMLAQRFTREGIERSTFRFSWKIMLRDMGFKQRTYPSMVFLPVILGVVFSKTLPAVVMRDWSLGLTKCCLPST